MPQFSQILRLTFYAGLIVVQFLVIVNYINQNSTVASQASTIDKNITQEQDKQKALLNNLQQGINEEIRLNLTQSARSGPMTRVEPSKVIQLNPGTSNSQISSVSSTKAQNTKPLVN
jgi:hypothetical protein